ncbi:putative WD-repeat protein [Bisporella sp. PMI_857]|nr:putative WD-repeat protein [Bisporella sp. PMI_857]
MAKGERTRSSDSGRRSTNFQRASAELWFNVLHSNQLTGNSGLDRLPFAADAPFNSYNKQHAPTCLPDTRVDLLQEIYDWADAQDERCIFWLNGLAGTGKSTIARTIAYRYFDQKRLGASFFFSKGGGDVGHATKLFTSFAVQLACHVPQIQEFISDAVTEQNDIANQPLGDQWRQLVLRPLSRLESGSFLSSYVFIVDALDECDSEDDIRMILQLLTEVQKLKTVRIRVFLTSRPEIPIRHGFCHIPNAEHMDFVLHNISPVIVNHDISIFLEYNLEAIRQKLSLEAGWPGEQVIRRLVQNSSGLFIWAATACRFIREGKKRQVIKDRLSSILQSNGPITEPEKHLNGIYTTVLRHSIPTEFSDKEKEEFSSKLRHMLGSILVLFSPLSIYSLSTLLRISEEDIDETLEDLHAILDIPKSQIRPLHLHHPSFRDFLLNKDRCGDPKFWVDEKRAHQTLADDCIRLMSNSLKQDICGQGAPGTLVADVESSRIEQCLPPEVKYACLYWIQHLQKSDAQLHDNGQVHRFLQVHLLHWLEALGWMGKTSEGILAIISLEGIIPASKSSSLHAFVYDAKRFALSNRTVVEQAPLQLYCSALIFAPEESIVRGEFEKYVPPWIQTKPKVQVNWNATLQTLTGHSESIWSVAFSPDSRQVVSSSADKTVRLWEAATGATLQTLTGHSDSVYSVAFSPDGKQVVSGSGDNTVRLWDAATGAALQILQSHSGSVYSVAFSPDGKQVVSGSSDNTVQFWDAATGVALQILQGHSGSVQSVAFSPDGKPVISGSADHRVRLWNPATNALLPLFKGRWRSVRSVAFSPNGKQVVSGSDDKTVRLWDAATKAALRTLTGHSDSVCSVAFSPDGKQVISGSADKTVRLWDAVTGTAMRILQSHSGLVNSVAFSPDGKQVISGSDNKTVRLWDAATGTALQTLKGHSDSVSSVAFSPDGKQVISGSDDKTVRLWDAATGAAPQMLTGHRRHVYSVAFSPDGKQVVSSSADNTVRLWNAATGAALQTFRGSLGSVWSAAFSPDSKQVVSGSTDDSVWLWDAATGAALQTLTGHRSWVYSVAFSPDGKRVVSGSGDNTVRLWDTATGAALQILQGHSDSVRSVAFSPDGKQVISGSDDETVRIWDAATGTTLRTLKGHSDSISSVAFSPGVPTLLVSNDWVVEGRTRILWLPPDYRSPTCVAVRNGILVLGYSSGQISILGFQEGSKVL